MRETIAIDLNYRKAWLMLGWLLIGAVIYLSLTPRPLELLRFDQADKLNHSIAYMTLMAWFCQLFLTGRQRLMLGMTFVAMGIALEFLQRMTGYRFFDYADMLANLSGVIIGWMLMQTRLRGSLATLDRRLRSALR